MQHKMTVLIAEDSAVNRMMLVRLLSEEYELIEAENGSEALKLLNKNSKRVSAVISDIVMPVMDGFGLLRAMGESESLRGIPIIVATGNNSEESEVAALKLGAWDFITKPYNAEIIKFRLRGAIERSQMAAFKKLKYLAEYDTLTGIYNKHKFFEAARAVIDDAPDQSYAFVRLDIERFQLINSFFGVAEGDRLLCFIAKGLAGAQAAFGLTYGRIEADVFAACFKYDTKQRVVELIDRAKKEMKDYNRNFGIIPVFGVYYIDDISIPVSEMLDRATLAARTCKGSYTDTVAVYRTELSDRLQKEQTIINEMAIAIEQHQFCVYFQPKLSLVTERPNGAEALVRWNHPQKGMIPPSEFIPVFEKNGFIAKLDGYVWEEVCRMLREWMDRGIDPQPISVNVSRVDICNPHIVGIISGIAKKYNIAPRLLQLEITESAYIENPQMMEKMIDGLHGHGFSVLMDDFGSGYSSLSVLKDLDVDVLKIDMRFFERTRVSGRGENIVASVIRMAKWLNMPVVAEGVETDEQISFLREVGCDCIQGYWFAKPIEEREYIKLITSSENRRDTVSSQSVCAINPDRLWSLDPEMLLLFAHDPTPKAVYEFNGKTVEALRVNNAYKALFVDTDEVSEIDPLEFAVKECRSEVLHTFKACADTKGVKSCRYRRQSHGKVLWVELTLQYALPMRERSVILGNLVDITPRITLEQKYAELIGRLENRNRFKEDSVFSVCDLRELLAYLSQVFDVARLVDPKTTSVVEFGEGGCIDYKRYTCFKVWDKDTRCDNCTSINAMLAGCRMTKYEYIKNDIFYVVSNPVTLVGPDGALLQLSLELVSHVSDHISISGADDRTLGEIIEDTQRKIYSDELTGAYNRRYLSELLFSHHRQTGISQRLGIVLIDLRSFKNINDTYGHGMGDSMLVAAAKKLKETVRESDSVIRYGGDEFVVALTNCTEVQVRSAILRMRRAIGTLRFGREREHALKADFGYSYTDNFDMKLQTVEKMINAADAEMYIEKNEQGKGHSQRR